ncbi:MAG: MOSC domain-containing protein [Candidatus Lambdaproteobacteria bacterium]|nr:MOSC domain-containing protein [Candidatus Lambdaproteobacteria bacterium]
MDNEGRVVGLHICAEARAALHDVAEVEAITGRGLAGDRYLRGTGTYSQRPGTGRQVTMIEAETLQALADEHGIALSGAEARRNIVTRGVRLDGLIGATFRVGGATLRGMRPCEPCAYLQELTGKPVLAPLTHRGGLRADILVGGAIRVGDAIVAETASAQAVPLPAGATRDE